MATSAGGNPALGSNASYASDRPLPFGRLACAARSMGAPSKVTSIFAGASDVLATNTAKQPPLEAAWPSRSTAWYSQPTLLASIFATSQPLAHTPSWQTSPGPHAAHSVGPASTRPPPDPAAGPPEVEPGSWPGPAPGSSVAAQPAEKR